MNFIKRAPCNLLSVVFLWFFVISAHAANVQCLDTRGTVAIRFIGAIEINDYQKVVSCWEARTSPVKGHDFVMTYPAQLVISSKGGLVSEAMKVGRFVRSKKIWVTVPADWGECFSSCVYILAAGVVKHPWGDVGIHRPYFVAPPSQSYDISLKMMLSQSKEYFLEMNVSGSLADDMFSTPPSEIKMLGDMLLSKYRLSQTDMAYEEENAMRNARAYGLSRQEYERRQKISEHLATECRAKYIYIDKDDLSEVDGVIISCANLAQKRAGLILKNN